MKRIIAAMIMVLVSVMLLSGCSRYVYFGGLGFFVPSEDKKRWREVQKSWDEEKAILIAQSYLEEKYGEKFIYVSDTVLTHHVSFTHHYPDDLVVLCYFKRKDDEKEKKTMEYQVEVAYKPGEYTVVGDDYMFVYIRKVAEDFLIPYIENRFSDMDFVFFLKRAKEQCGLRGEYRADAKIPQSFDELYDVTKEIDFQIIVPMSEDQNKVSEAYSLLKSDLDELNMEIVIDVYIEVYRNDRFAEISQSSDPRIWKYEGLN